MLTEKKKGGIHPQEWFPKYLGAYPEDLVLRHIVWDLTDHEDSRKKNQMNETERNIGEKSQQSISDITVLCPSSIIQAAV